jgi:hypothetical protein
VSLSLSLSLSVSLSLCLRAHESEWEVVTSGCVYKSPGEVSVYCSLKTRP